MMDAGAMVESFLGKTTVEVLKGNGPPITKAWRSFILSTLLFFAFVAFANWLHHLHCGYWCNMFFGSYR